MNTLPVVDHDIDTRTIEALDFEPGCEHQFHQGDTRRHNGPAAWFQTGTCPECGEPLNALVCDRWRQHISSCARTSYMRSTCPTLKHSFPTHQANFTFTRI